ncbi:hypothetical protein K420107F6_37070 [Lactonifactor longoviformis]
MTVSMGKCNEKKGAAILEAPFLSVSHRIKEELFKNEFTGRKVRKEHGETDG